MLKRITPAVFCLVFTRLLFSQQVLDRIVAVVDDEIILKTELDQFAYSTAIQYKLDPEKDPEGFERLKAESLNTLILQKVLLAKAKEDTVVVSEERVEEVLNGQIQQMVTQLGSEKRVEEYFGTTIREMRRDFRDRVEERLLVQQIQETKAREIQITRREIEEFFRANQDSLPPKSESVRLSHILVAVTPSEGAESLVRKKGEDVLERLKKGEDFSAMAKEYSEDPGTATKGGDLGMMSRGDFVRPFEEAAFQLEPGELSDLVRTQFGWHVIQLVSKAGDRIHLRHILLRLDTSEEDTERTIDMLLSLRKDIMDGKASFEATAAEHSRDETSADKGGDLGYFDPQQFQFDSFKKAAEKLEVGEISEPLKTPSGFHLVKLTERKAARALSLKDDWEQIEAWALDMKRRREFQAWVEEIKKDFYIDIRT